MKPPPFDYHRPESVTAAIALLGRLENAKLLAGGQSLMPMLNLRYLYPDHVVDLNRIPDLAGFSFAGERLRIGAMTRQRAIEVSPEVARVAPIFPEALKLVGHRQTRNRGTIGGSLCHLDPAAELPTLALLYDAEIKIAGPAGLRSVSMRDFMAGYMTPALKAGELVIAVSLPFWPAGHGWGFVEFARRHGDFAIASAGVLLEKGGDGRIKRAAVAVGGVEPVPVRLTAAETMLVGEPPGEGLFARVAACCANLDALEDVHGGADYRRSVAGAMVMRALAAADARIKAPEAVR
jgi:aerobic carbon-monoxide dehydrogenase medium subunit